MRATPLDPDASFFNFLTASPIDLMFSFEAAIKAADIEATIGT